MIASNPYVLKLQLSHISITLRHMLISTQLAFCYCMSSPCLLLRNSLPVRHHLRYEGNFALRWGHDHQYSSRNLQKAWFANCKGIRFRTGKFLLVESGLRETFAYGICNPGPYFRIQLKECRIPRTIGIHNPSSTVKDWYPVPGIRNPRLGIQNPRFHYMGDVVLTF